MTSDQPKDSVATEQTTSTPPIQASANESAEKPTPASTEPRGGGQQGSEGQRERAARIAIGSQRAGSPIIRPGVSPTLFRHPVKPPAGGFTTAPTSSSTPAAPIAEPSVVETPAVEAPVAPSPPVAPVAEAPAPSAPVPASAAPPATAPQEPKKPSRPQREPAPRPAEKTPVPSLRAELPEDLQRELAEALGDMSLDDILAPATQSKTAAVEMADLLPESKHTARVASIHRDDVFVEMGGRNQGVLSLRTFPKPPEIGDMVEVVVNRFNGDEGLYVLTLPHSAIRAAHWEDIAEGVMVEARCTGHNKGGLECEVNNIRAFIPASQIDVYRVEDLEQFVGQKFSAIVTEARPERGNLILSRRAVIERQKESAKATLMTELAEGQIREGTVRSLQDFGAFVDLGGVDGLLHISQLAWHRVKHPSDVLQLGQAVKVMIRKIDPETHKISLSLRDTAENPWSTVAAKYPVHSTARGAVTKVMDFGAFVQLEPGIEGLVHISELAHQRVFRTSDIVKEGDTVEVKVLSVDTDQQRIGLSMKALAARPVSAKEKKAKEEEEEAPLPPIVSKRTEPLKGGIGRGSGGDKFGLKW
ncbi:MAG TPA: S1 RNA-binding domain-containing protein [Pirellulales bacterium]|jgi:small subunit ribosomal protein S1